MNKVTSKNGKDYGYNYFTCHVNFDENDPYQQECVEFLKKLGRSKNKFFSILIHQFMSQFKDPGAISAEDIRKYINYYELATKMTNDAVNGNGFYPVNQLFIQQTPPIPNQPVSAQPTAPIPSQTMFVEKEPETLEDNTDVLAAMDMFSV